jgi:hypothetical protein
LGLLVAVFDFFNAQSILATSENSFTKMSSLGEAWPVIFIGAGMLIAAPFWGEHSKESESAWMRAWNHSI